MKISQICRIAVASLSVLPGISYSVYGQKMRTDNNHLSIDTVITTTKTKEQAFNAAKSFLIQNMPDYKTFLKGEVPGELISTRVILKYYALGGEQKHVNDLNITFTDNQVNIRMDNIYTTTDGNQSWSADKFFLKADGSYKGAAKKWVPSVEEKFKILSSDIAASVR